MGQPMGAYSGQSMERMDDSRQRWANGGLIGAAFLLLALGVMHLFAGIAAFARSNFYTINAASYPYHASNTAWGWIHTIGGAVLVLTGLALFSGRMWARIVAIALVAVSAVANFFFIPFFPLWALTMLAFDIFVIWAISNARPGAAQTGAMSAYQQPGMARSAYMGGQGYESQGAHAGQRWPENVQQDATGRHWVSDTKGEGIGARHVDNAQEAQQSQYAGRAAGQGQPQAGSTSEDVTARARRMADDAARKNQGS